MPSNQVFAPLYVWELPGKDGAIHLSLDVVERLGAAVMKGLAAKSERPLEVGGILLGTIRPGETWTTVIEDFLPLSCEHARGASWSLSAKDRKGLEDRLRRGGWQRGLGVVGLFRSHTRLGLYLDQDDFNIFSNYCNDPRQVFLLVRPNPGAADVAGFFVWEEGDVRRQAPHQPFPFDAQLLAAGEKVAVPAPETGARRRVAPPAAAPRAIPAPRTPRTPRTWHVPTPAVLAVLSLAGGLGIYRFLAAELIRTEPPAPARASASLALQVERTADGLRLVWSRESPVLRDARSGVVLISEGPRQFRVDLSPRQLAGGSVMYFPGGGEVTFDMEVQGARGKTAESVHAVVPPAPVAAIPPAPVADVPPAPEMTAQHRPRSPRNEAHRTAHFIPPARVVVDVEPVQTMEPPPTLTAAAVPRPHPEPAFLRPRVRRATVTYEPAAPSRFTRVIGKIPVLRALQSPRAGKDYVPPAPLKEINPAIPADLSLEPAEEAVDLKVHIDEAGQVQRAEVLSRGDEDRLATRLAAGAAREWRFEPARLNGKPVPSEMVLHFKY